jgi:ubiquinone/menaquinone biosynthesis C-methylase UbiE
MTHPSVQAHYSAADIVARILAAIPWRKETDAPLKAAQLFPYDQLHGRELLATQDHAARLAPDRQAHLLDIGSGIGGPARYFAANFGCHVTGIDLTDTFVAAATELGNLCGLGDLVRFQIADATDIPFEAGAFDHAYCFYVGMNLPDKFAVLSQAFRVLKPGGRLLWTEVVETGDVPHYPLPWARTPGGSHVLTQKALQALFTRAGFDVDAVENETGAHLELAQKMKQSGKVPTSGQTQANEVVLGPDFVQRRMNYIKSLAEGRFASLLIEARKPA